MTDAWTADVVVIGGGLAGHFAAIEANAAGAECLLLEKESAIGGSTVLSGGFFALCGTQEQATAGVTDTAELLLDDLWEVSGRRADRELLSSYVQSQLELYEWLVDHGIPFSQPVRSGGQSVPRSHQTDPKQLLDTVAESARAAGVRTVTDARVTRLSRSGTSGEVTGCTMQVDGREEPVAARRGVVLASGGFSHGTDLLEVFAPQQREAVAIGGPGNVGDGLRMGWALGADVRDMGFIKGTFGTHPKGTTAQQHAILLTFYKGSIVVNSAGERFVDESISYKDIGDACLKQPDKLGVQVFDAGIARECNNGIPLFDLTQAQLQGLLVVADDLEELAGRAGIEPSGLRRTVERYNSDIRENRVDSIGRRTLCHGVGDLLEIAEPPFYAYPSTTALLATYCGLRITRRAEVLDVWGERIPRLYAAGEVTGGFHGAAYMTGSALGKAAVFGRIAGMHAAGHPPL
jgi:fumarate reductase flavoprotein subunit